MVYDYYASGAHDERTLGRNREAWAELPLHYRVLVDVSTRSAATTVLGRRVPMPVLAAPTAFHGLAHPEGERATARAVGGTGGIMLLSTLSTAPVE
jgi:4-hydroxymandelate oxidase